MLSLSFRGHCESQGCKTCHTHNLISFLMTVTDKFKKEKHCRQIKSIEENKGKKQSATHLWLWTTYFYFLGSTGCIPKVITSWIIESSITDGDLFVYWKASRPFLSTILNMFVNPGCIVKAPYFCTKWHSTFNTQRLQFRK